MSYKINWHFRFAYEKEKLQEELPDYEVVSSSSARILTYDKHEIEQLIK